MNADGSVAITDHGSPVAIAAGRSLTLSGGETVSENSDGSVVVSAAGGQGGTIATTLRAFGASVDTSTRAQNVSVGGDIANGIATKPPVTLRHPERVEG